LTNYGRVRRQITSISVAAQPVVRVLIGDWWREIRLRRGAWSGGQEAAYEKIVTGAANGELFFPLPTDDAQPGKIMCRVVAWLPRERMEDEPQDVPPVREIQPDPGMIDVNRTTIRDLREAIRANRVSFPSQVPTFAGQDRPDLQCKLAQLYFVMGWDCGDIGRRLQLTPVRRPASVPVRRLSFPRAQKGTRSIRQARLS
jgi:hypothetical protein